MKKQEKNSNIKKNKKKRGSIDKKNNQKVQLESNSSNFWDIDKDINNEGINYFNITSFENKATKQNSFFNKFKNKNVEKERNNNASYEKYNKLIKKDNKEIISNYNAQLKYIPFQRETNNYNKSEYRCNSVDINKKKKKIINFDKLSVFKRNKKWLENKKQKLDKEIEKYINKREKEFQNILKYRNINKKDTDINNIFNEEDNVISRPENYNFFMRLIQGREERERAMEPNSSYDKINCLKNSHYSGRQKGNISQKEMKKYIKYIHNELKETTNQN